MKRRTMLHAAVVAAALFVAGCSGPCSRIGKITAPAPSGGSADFHVYVALGTSIGAGYESGGLVFRHQEHAYPALFAHQVGAPFTYPAISDSGLPPLLQLSSLQGPVILRGTHPGSPTNLALPTPYTNLSVPGMLLFDLADSSLYATDSTRLPVFTIIGRHHGTILQQAEALHPTFVSFEFGANEVLGPATGGSGTPILGGAAFAALLHVRLDSLQAGMPNAKLAIFTVPDVTTIPFVTTIPPVLVDPATRQPVLVGGHTVPLIGPEGPLSAHDFVLLPAAALLAQGIGVPAAAGGTDQPLPDAVVLSASEAASIRTAVDAYNAALLAESAARDAALVDLHGLLMEAATTGIELKGVRYSSAFLTGGLFSLDGIHPTDLGHGLIANRMIDAVNAKFGASVPRVDLTEAASASASRLRPSGIGSGPGGLRVEGLDPVLRMLNPRR